MKIDFRPSSDVFSDILTYLEKSGYSKITIGKYRATYRSITNFMNTDTAFIFDPDACQKYVIWVSGGKERCELTRNTQNKIRCANAMLEYQLTGSVLFNSSLKGLPIPEGVLFQAVSAYLDDKRSIGYAESTLYTHHTYIIKFCSHLISVSKESFSKIESSDILEFVDSLSFCKTGTVSSALAPLRAFLKYIHQRGMTAVDLSYVVPRDPAPRQAKLPSQYSQEEVKKIIESIDRSSPKGIRNYAIVLLLVETGLRSSDICAITFEDIDWEKSLLHLTQYKTGGQVEIPLLSNAGNAIIEYLKKARPHSDLRNIFLRLSPPFSSLTPHQVRNIVGEYIRKAGVNENVPKRKAGSHVLRHSLAGRLLQENTPLPVISGVLGHASSESTKFYLGIDTEQLKNCALDVPGCSFYESKGAAK